MWSDFSLMKEVRRVTGARKLLSTCLAVDLYVDICSSALVELLFAGNNGELRLGLVAIRTYQPCLALIIVQQISSDCFWQ